MKCQVMLINRGRTRWYKRANFDTSTIKVRMGFRKEETYHIPDKTQFLEMERKRGTIPLFLVDELTYNALSWYFVEDEKVGYIGVGISQLSDPVTKFKLNVLAKASFWEMLAKKLKMSLMSTIIYMGAGYGVFRFAEYAIRIIFLKEG